MAKYNQETALDHIHSITIFSYYQSNIDKKIVFKVKGFLESNAYEHKNKRLCDPKELNVLWRIV